MSEISNTEIEDSFLETEHSLYTFCDTLHGLIVSYHEEKISFDEYKEGFELSNKKVKPIFRFMDPVAVLEAGEFDFEIIRSDLIERLNLYKTIIIENSSAGVRKEPICYIPKYISPYYAKKQTEMAGINTGRKQEGRKAERHK